MGMFVGRAEEFAALSGLAPGVVDGRPAAAVMIAEPGIGKTRLLAEVASALELPCVRLRGYEPAREIPLGAAGDLLRELSGAGEAGGRLEALLLGDAGSGQGLGTVRVFEAAFRCLVGRGPLAVVIDDLQWADRETLALLHYLLSACQRQSVPLLLLCASRPAPEPKALAAALAGLLAPECFVELTLGPLGLEDGVELAVRLAPGLGHEEAQALWRGAGGSPFWLKALAAGDGAAASPVGLIRARSAGLDADSGRLFALLVVAAQPLGVADAAELLAWEEQRARRAALVLGNRALAVDEAGAVRVVHDLVREAATRELPDAERRRLHRRLAEWFEAAAGEDLQSLSRALEHRQAAGLPTADLAVRIARSPQRRLLGREGLMMLDRIAGEALNGEGLVLWRETAGLASELGEWTLALERWSVLADRLPTGSERAKAALEAAHAAVRLERPDEAYVLVSRARALAPDEPLLAIEADVREGQALRWLENRVSEAQARTDRAATAARDLVERAGGTDALTDDERRAYLAAVRAQLDAGIRAGDADAVARCADEIVESAREVVEVLGATFDRIFGLIMFDGLPRLAEPRARRALEEARRLVLPLIEVEAIHWLGWTLHYIGALEEAERLTWQTVALAERVGPPDRFGLPNLRATAHMASASRGDWRGAVAGIRDQVDEVREPHYRLNVRMMHAPLVSRFASPSRREVDDLLAGMAADADAAGCERCRWQSVLIGADALARLGDIDAARTALEEWDLARPQPRPGPAAHRRHVEALVEARRDPVASAAVFAHAAELAQRAGQGLRQLWIELDAALTLVTVDHPGGVEALRSVAQRAESMGALSEQQLAEQRLRALGARTWRRGPTSDAGVLSARERQIADLVVTGASNPEIAQALFLSRKTVERHVSNVLAKLGAHNRVELAALHSRDSEAAAQKTEGVTR